MMSHTAQQLADLKAPHQIRNLVKFQIGNTWHYLTDSDLVIQYAGNDYLPGFLSEDSIDDIEITSEPSTNDIDMQINTFNNLYLAAILSGGWMNKPVTIYKYHSNKFGEILTKVAFEGFLSSYSLDEKNSQISLTVSSIWADYEKQVGIKTNITSHQRYYPGDTGMRHAANAKKKVYWGKDAPSSTSGGGGTGGGGSRFGNPQDNLA